MRNVLIFLCLFFLSASQASAGIFVYTPKDKGVSFDEVVMLDGAGKGLKTLEINGFPVKFKSNDSFSCGLSLGYGKNYVEIKALDKQEKSFVQKLRVLRLKTYPDLESEVDEKKHWARNQIVHLSTQGFIEGYPDGNFYPSNPVSRGELATWMARVRELPLPPLDEDVFFDVPKEHWRAPYIKAVVDKGYMKSYPNLTFGIDDPVSRREAAEIAVKVEGVKIVEKIKFLFMDVPKEEKGATPIYSARKEGLLIGVSEDLPIYDPNRALTRAEAAVLLGRFDQAIASIKSLFNFEEGYDQADFARLDVVPEIVSFKVLPENIQSEKETTVTLTAKIARRTGFYPVSKVKADLSKLGGPADLELLDDGTQGDEAKGDGVYSLNVSLVPLGNGAKTITVTAIDLLGWESKKEAAVLLLKQ